MRFLQILAVGEIILIATTILSQIPFTVITFVDKNYYFSQELNKTIFEIQNQAKRLFIKQIVNPSLSTYCDQYKMINGNSYCITKLKTNQSQIIKSQSNCPSNLNYTISTFNTNSRKYCFSIAYNPSFCLQGTNCYNTSSYLFPLQDIDNETLVLNQFIGSTSTSNVNCDYLNNFFKNLVQRTQDDYRVLNIVLLTFWFVNLIPVFIQVITTCLHFFKKNRVKYITYGVVKITTLITLLFQLAMGLTIIIISFHITSDSQSIRDYNQCFIGKYQIQLQRFPFLQGNLMGNFKFFVIFLTIFIFSLGVLLIIMQMFGRAYKQAQDSFSHDSYYQMTSIQRESN